MPKKRREGISVAQEVRRAACCRGSREAAVAKRSLDAAIKQTEEERLWKPKELE